MASSEESYRSSPPYLSPNVKKIIGWGAVERDDQDNPFQWIGRAAAIRVKLQHGTSYLFLNAGSPKFSGIRHLTVVGPGINEKLKIRPGWHTYNIKLSEGENSREIELVLTVDRLVEVSNDPRELGLMIKDIHCVSHAIDRHERNAMAQYENASKRQRLLEEADAPGVIWLTSFPRSGNTWMRFLLSNLLYEPVEISAKVGDYIPEIIDPVIAKEPKHKDHNIDFNGQTAQIFKSHLPYSHAMPLRQRTLGAIYVIRNPLDIALSLSRSHAYQHDHGNTLENFLAYGVDSATALSYAVNWHLHVHSWLEMAEASNSFPICLIQFEELVTNPHAACTKVLKWLGFNRSSQQIDQAINRSSLENLRKIEQQEVSQQIPGIFYNLEDKPRIDKGWRFLNDGKVDGYLNSLTKKQIQQGMATFGAAMAKYNYTCISPTK